MKMLAWIQPGNRQRLEKVRMRDLCLAVRPFKKLPCTPDHGSSTPGEKQMNRHLERLAFKRKLKSMAKSWLSSRFWWPGNEKKMNWQKDELQCFSYRRFFASPDASSLIWTQVERFGRFSKCYFQCVFSVVATTEIKIEVQSKYRGMNCEQFVSSLFTKHADVFPALCVVASAAAVLPVTNASPEQGIFNPEQDWFWQSCRTDFWKEPSTSWWEFASKARQAARWISQGFGAVAISENPPHFMSWSSALTENCPLRLPAYV